MDGRGRVYDNIFVERLWRSVKCEDVYLRSYLAVREARREIGRYLEFNNRERPHQSLHDWTPAEVYFKSPWKKSDRLWPAHLSDICVRRSSTIQPIHLRLRAFISDKMTRPRDRSASSPGCEHCVFLFEYRLGPGHNLST